MKKLLCSLLVWGLFIGLTGCSDKGTGYSENKEYLNQLSKDENVVDFVLNGQYYQLTCILSEFTDNGWSYVKDYNEYEFDSIMLKPKTYIEARFKDEDDNEITLEIVNDNDADTIPITSGKVIKLEYNVNEDVKKDFIVIKNGVTPTTSKSDVIDAFDKYSNFKDDESTIELSSNDDKSLAIIIDFDGNQIDYIKLNSANSIDYSKYISDKVKLERSNELKSKAVANVMDYNQLVSSSKNKNLIDYTIKGVVTDYTGVSSFNASYATGYVYLIKDENGNLYAIDANEIPKLLNVGDTVEIWGTTNNVLEMEDKSYIPFINASIINKADSEVYNNIEY